MRKHTRINVIENANHSHSFPARHNITASQHPCPPPHTQTQIALLVIKHVNVFSSIGRESIVKYYMYPIDYPSLQLPEKVKHKLEQNKRPRRNKSRRQETRQRPP